MNKLYCRTFQFGMKIANYFLGYRTPEVISGINSIYKLPKFILNQGVHKILLVTDNGLINLGLPNGLIKAMEEDGLEYVIFSNIQPNPTDINVEEGYKIFKDNKCEGIIAFGGGSPMDCAKAIAAKNAHPNKSVKQLQGILKVHKKICPFYAVPTTAGTGSETTVAAVITEASTHHKAAINDPAILPKYAVLDPELTRGLPKSITATTGMDALCHAVEAYTNHTYNTKEEDERAKNAVKLIYNNLYDAYIDGNNMQARQNMQIASFDAGRAFTRGCVGYVHAIGHTLGGLYGIAHGQAMSVILPYVLRYYGEAVYDKLADLADGCCINGKNNKEKANNFISWIEEMNEKMNIPKGFDCIKDEDIDQIIKWADKEANPLYPVPVLWDYDDFYSVINNIRL